MPLPRGNYDPETVYDVLDIVTHNYKPWVCCKPNTFNIEPTAENSENWFLLIDVDITNADTLDGHDSSYFASLAKLQDSFETVELVFPASGWSTSAPYTQTVTYTDVKATDSPLPFLVDDSTTEDTSKGKKKAYGYITYFDSADGSITATCKYQRPTVDLTIGFKGVLNV